MIHADDAYPFADLELARRLERAEARANAAFVEARANAAFVEARARLRPESGAGWTEVAGAYAMFDGPGSPLTQSFGLGLFAEAGPAELEALEGFFRERGAEVFHETSPLAGPGLAGRLGGRGYRPVEFTSVLFRPTPAAGSPAGEGAVRVRPAGADEADLWARTAAEGWATESPELGDFMLDMGRTVARAEGTSCFLAELDGAPVAAGALSLSDGVALLAGASTIPSARSRGAQRALLEARLRFARERGCGLAMMAALPGSASQRNAERQGFRVAYTRVKWHLPPSAPAGEAPSGA